MINRSRRRSLIRMDVWRSPWLRNSARQDALIFEKSGFVWLYWKSDLPWPAVSHRSSVVRSKDWACNQIQVLTSVKSTTAERFQPPRKILNVCDRGILLLKPIADEMSVGRATYLCHEQSRNMWSYSPRRINAKLFVVTTSKPLTYLERVSVFSVKCLVVRCH